MNWYKSESATQPLEIDTISSKKYNYVRRNIEQATREDTTVYKYEECKILKEDWGLYLENEQLRADLDYIAMETGVEL